MSFFRKTMSMCCGMVGRTELMVAAPLPKSGALPDWFGETDRQTIQAQIWCKDSFMPLNPERILPDQPEFKEVVTLLKAMSVILPDGSAGLVARNQFREAVKALPNVTPHIQRILEERRGVNDPESAQLLASLHMVFQGLQMGYLFEGTRHGETKAPEVLPAAIAQPLLLLCEITGHKPYLEYASGYVLQAALLPPTSASVNWQDPSSVQQFIREINVLWAFHGGKDELHFRTVHAAMESRSPQLFRAGQLITTGVAQDKEDLVIGGYALLAKTLKEMNAAFKQMIPLSKNQNYSKDVRPQIQGMVSNQGDGKYFHERGLFFEGCGWVSGIHGQTGAQSSIFRYADVLTGLSALTREGEPLSEKDNDLSGLLKAFRIYRPAAHLRAVKELEGAFQAHQVNDYVQAHPRAALACANAVLEEAQHRLDHFSYVQSYITSQANGTGLGRTHGTGGSETPRYLPDLGSQTLAHFDHLMSTVATSPLHTSAEYVEAMVRAGEIRSKLSAILAKVHSNLRA